MDELVIKVPSPFSGVDDVGFSARYPAQAWNERLRDVPFIVEGPPLPMRRLVQRLSLFTAKDSLITDRGDDEAYSWTSPVQLTDEVCVLAFRDHSLRDLDDEGQAGRQYIWNLVRPLAFTFLRDCVRLGGLRLADRIAVVVDVGRPPLVDLELQRSAISAENGTLLLAA
ncbi:MAG: hypothetical protein JF887_12780 [Candidatus Dormibacteraeota bacterium]|uniref:Uncharacterized protein n=1 Tax=Candidatus Amunia macphersoniae TaxID=3127014 RepID=A0A934KMA6_9BACT|nr:hypothetical protein [Candidatus Dormibacteraeota bacterium]